MANWTTLKAAIANTIKTNGDQEITGQILQNALNNIISSVGENATFVGIATPTTNPGTPDGPVFYLASEAGTYSNFNGLVVNANEASILQFNNGTWIKKNTGLAPKSLMAVSSAGIRYTYWTPTTIPVLEKISDAMLTITYNKLTIVDILGPIVFDTFSFGTPGVVNIDNHGAILVYAKIVSTNEIELHYDYISRPSSATEIGDYENITDISKVIPLAIAENGKMEDILKIVSRSQFGIIPSLGTDIKNLNNFIDKICPDNNSTDQILFNKYYWDIRGDKEISTNTNIRLSAVLHVKHKFFYVRGKVDFEPGKLANPRVFINDKNAHGTGEVNVFGPYNLTCDSKGNFAEFVPIPDSTWETIDFEHGYNAFVICQNFNKYNIGLHIYESYAGDYPGHDNEVILKNEQIEDTIKYATELNNLIDTTEVNKIFGNYDTKVLASCFPRAAHVNCSATTTNSEAESDGFLTEITARVKNGGTFAFKVGLLNQYSRFVVSYSFNLTLKDGLNVIDVSHLNIPIAKGEQVAISCTDIAETGTGSVSYQQNSSHIENELFYGSNNGIWSKLATTYGGEIILSYKMKQVETIFALKSQIKNLNEQIEKQNSTINSLRYVYDENSIPYKVAVIGGQLIAKSVQYKNVLALGNSLTSHGYAEDIGYYGDVEWAMASTNKIVTTWTNHLQTILRQKQSEAIVTPFNIVAWETNYMGVDLANLFKDHIGINYDMVLIRAGENGTAGSDYAQGVDRLVTFLRTNFPAANIIITNMFWHNSTKEAGFREIAEKYNYQYVSFGNIADRCLLGQMLLGKDDEFHPITHNGVAGHCTDVCFFNFANIVAKALGYSTISGKHEVNINTSKQYSINQTSQIKDGYVTILTYSSSIPDMTITKVSSGEEVSIQVFSLSDTQWINTPSTLPTYAVVFKMPDDDVNIEY